MSISCKFERSILSYDEHEIVLRSHHPEIYDAGLDELKGLRQRLRDMRAMTANGCNAANYHSQPPLP